MNVANKHAILSAVMLMSSVSLCVAGGLSLFDSGPSRYLLLDFSAGASIRGGACYKYGTVSCPVGQTCEAMDTCLYVKYDAAGNKIGTVQPGENEPGFVYKWECPANSYGVSDQRIDYSTCVRDDSSKDGFDDIKNRKTSDPTPEDMYVICYKVQYCNLDCGPLLSNGRPRCVQGAGAACPSTLDANCRKVLEECVTSEGVNCKPSSSL